MKTVIIGVGNPTLTDDGIGIHVAEVLRTALPAGLNITVRMAYAGGMRLMDAMVGFDKAILVDALWTGQNPPGTVVHLSKDDLQQSRNTSSVHDLDLCTALNFAESVGVKVPKDIEVWGVEISDATTFSEYPTPVVRAAVPHVVAEICRAAQRNADPTSEETFG
jgi:hydrogenase maturation protease